MSDVAASMGTVLVDEKDDHGRPCAAQARLDQALLRLERALQQKAARERHAREGEREHEGVGVERVQADERVDAGGDPKAKGEAAAGDALAGLRRQIGELKNENDRLRRNHRQLAGRLDVTISRVKQLLQELRISRPNG